MTLYRLQLGTRYIKMPGHAEIGHKMNFTFEDTDTGEIIVIESKNELTAIEEAHRMSTTFILIK